MKSIFNSIFSKNSKPAYHAQGYANQSDENIPHFTITENKSMQSDYEVAEISYEEFTKAALLERRKAPRKQGETRSTYFNQQHA
ncbi:MAG: hypothetical protein HOO90_10090 [Methylotenera sp.]|uniref:hypothetical protein n=1 Tax=Methylotenera sp. TaxID=2051956 RepID=UPI0017C37166|nr:hypothetical protein [Methylotenera sp.]NOU25866.1 hypothetical protein [Methylotenera sp.]